MELQQLLGSGLGIAIIVLVVILAILWFLLPFAVFGVKKRLDKIIEQNEQLITLQQMSNAKSGISRPVNKNERIEPTIKL